MVLAFKSTKQFALALVCALVLGICTSATEIEELLSTPSLSLYRLGVDVVLPLAQEQDPENQNFAKRCKLQVRNLATRFDSQNYHLVTIVKLTFVKATFALMKIVKKIDPTVFCHNYFVAL